MSTEADESARSAIAQALTLLQRNEAASALDLLRRAAALQPANADIKLHEALALRVLGRFSEALLTLDGILAIDPYSFMALLSKGLVLERMGHIRAAAKVYADALK